MNVQITIEGDGLNYKGDTNLTKAAQIIAFINSQASTTTPNASTQAFPSQPAALGGSVSPREILRESQASTFAQKILVLGKYTAVKNNHDAFSTKELQETFRRAGEALPRNLGRDIKDAITMGYIAPAEDSKDEYYVTNFGEDSITDKFSQTSDRTKKPSKSKSGRAIVRTSLSEEVKNLSIGADESGLPNYWSDSLKTNKSLRIVWLLSALQSKGIEELSCADIENLAKRLGDDIKAGTIPSKCTGLLKKTYIAKNPSGKFRVLKQGTDFLMSLKS